MPKINTNKINLKMKKILLFLIMTITFIACGKHEPKGIDFTPKMSLAPSPWLQGEWFFQSDKQVNEGDLIVSNTDIRTRNGVLSVKKEVEKMKSTGNPWFFQYQYFNENKFFYVIPTTDEYRNKKDFNGQPAEEYYIYYYKTIYTLNGNTLEVKKIPLNGGQNEAMPYVIDYKASDGTIKQKYFDYSGYTTVTYYYK